MYAKHVIFNFTFIHSFQTLKLNDYKFVVEIFFLKNNLQGIFSVSSKLSEIGPVHGICNIFHTNWPEKCIILIQLLKFEKI